jgi:antitoxin CcdA
MRMTRYLKEQPKPFERDGHGHIGPGPKPRLKRAVNVSVDAEILKVAKEMRLNLSQALEDALRKLTEEERARRFYEENKVFFDWHNAHIEKHGTLAEALYGADAFDDPAV